MVQQLGYLKETPSQTAGPYVHIGLTPNFCGIGGVYEADLGSRMVNGETRGERITITGRVIDGAGAPLKDALVEIWQADAAGLYNSPTEIRGSADANFAGWGRCSTGADDGVFSFETIKPGQVPYSHDRQMAPHITFWIVARGINVGLHTRMYFPDEAEANAADPLLARIEHRHRVATLVATGTAPNYVFDIHLQGEKETVFLDI
ncbi:protocatechuate 3,4-dioxygenase subunit alpha (plasmid) [Ensifer sp. PDNC004]|uniref:protocatechuate 3,4-dioxygenase subunit alpha n=1 Tax=unclassified Ensifer TaxID=2633371 RepID=UPI0017822CF9|nr:MULTISPECIES: protocatechuate 3,4-dioxygenase subunit alpha [unclassified Ensifer]MBD9651878.1 protocatechuate 3,4-dioxygenase subunit alpha [Ensifer sp. ENS09]QRY65351.1 protocatechuate 3,4-dioxygenase subunit alpha [Ensifer sp. PDNC004]